MALAWDIGNLSRFLGIRFLDRPGLRQQNKGGYLFCWAWRSLKGEIEKAEM
jgi:hypothetical protein